MDMASEQLSATFRDGVQIFKLFVAKELRLLFNNLRVCESYWHVACFMTQP